MNKTGKGNHTARFRRVEYNRQGVVLTRNRGFLSAIGYSD